MENIYRMKKRMVYPEKLTLDHVIRKTSDGVNSNKSWCEEPLEVVSNKSAENHDERSNKSASSERASSGVSANKEFIHERIRHLVDAFHYRTNAARQRLDMPATPTSLSSQETAEEGQTPPTPQTVQHKPLIITTDHDQEPSEHILEGKCSILRRITHICSNYVIDPQGKVYVVWMAIAALSVMYNGWMIPLRSTFPYQTPDNRYIFMAMDYICDLVYVVDFLLVQPRIMYLHEGFWIRDTTELRRHYYHDRHFKKDVACLLPLDLLYFLLGPERVILRLPRLVKVHTFWDFFNLIDRLLATPHMVRIIRTLTYMMYLIHLNACAYYAFSAWEGIGYNKFVYNGKGNAYIVCFYFATKTATSIGKNPKPTHEIEYMFMTFSWLMGVFVFALMIGQIRDIITTATKSQTEYRKLVDETSEYMRRLHLPHEMQERVKHWFSYTWDTQHTLDENTIMDCLPQKMKTDISINVHIQTLSKVKLFADCDEALLRELVLQLKSVIYLPGDMIVRKGDVGKEMYIIKSGQVQVLGRTNDEVLATLSEGSVFGEISLLGIPGMNRRTACVRSKGYSNLFVLSKESLSAALSQHPDAQEILNKKAKQLMKKNAQLEKDEKAVIVIENPKNTPHVKLLDTVMQVVRPDSAADRFLRYGSRGRPRLSDSSTDQLRPMSVESVRHNSMPDGFMINEIDESDRKLFETKVTVHRTMS